MKENKLNIFYFVIFTIFLIILQAYLYSGIFKMNSLNLKFYQLKKFSYDLFQKIEVEGYDKYKSEFSKKGFKDVYVFTEMQDKKYPFIFNRILRNSLNKKYLKESSYTDKMIYDSCDSPYKPIKFKDTYFLAYKNKNKCFVFQSKNISKYLNSGLSSMWYFLIGIVLILLSLFVFIPKNFKNKLILSLITIAYDIFFYLYSLISV